MKPGNVILKKRKQTFSWRKRNLPSMRMLQLAQARLHPEKESCARI
jgi:hypothetical protein